MADNAGGGGYSAPVAVPPAQAQALTQQQPSQGGQQPAWNPSPNRGRVGDFGAWGQGGAGQQTQVMGADGIAGQQIALADPDAFAGQDPNDPFSPIAGTGVDAQSQALAVEDQGDQGQQFEGDESVQAEVMSQADLRALLEEHRVWRDSDDLAGPLMSKFVPVTIEGKRYRIPVEEAAKGFQRNQDYSNKLREVYALKQTVENRENGLRRLIDDLSRDGQSFYETMEGLGLFKQFADAAIIYGTHLKAEREMSPEARAQAGANRELRIQARRIEAENRRLQAQLQAAAQHQQQQPGGADQVEAIRMQQIAHLLPSVAGRMGLVQTPLAMAEFERHFANMLPSLNGGDITTDFLENVVGAAIESVNAQVAAHRSWQEVPQPTTNPVQLARDPQGRIRNIAPQQGGQRQAAPPVGRMSGPSTPATNGRANSRMRIGEFDRAVRGKQP